MFKSLRTLRLSAVPPTRYFLPMVGVVPLFRDQCKTTAAFLSPKPLSLTQTKYPMKYLIFSIIVFCAISCTGPAVKVQRYTEAERDSLLAVVESLSVQIGSMQEQLDANDSLTGVSYMLAIQADSNSKNAIFGVNKITKKDLLLYQAGKFVDGMTGRKISQAAELLR